VTEVLANYGLFVDELLESDIDNLETDELRNLWLRRWFQVRLDDSREQRYEGKLCLVKCPGFLAAAFNAFDMSYN